MPLVFAGDPAPQQLTAPCRKYQAALRHPIEQPVYRTNCAGFLGFLSVFRKIRYGRAYGTVYSITKLIVVCSVLAPVPARGSHQDLSASLKGTVVDARSGVPLPRILVAVEGGPSAETDADGRFHLTGITPGPVRLYVSAVGYGLVQRTLRLEPGTETELQIPLSEGAATYTETVIVTPDRLRGADHGVPAVQTLGSADLQNLRGVVADDALRAVQVLPGVATGDDFRSEFSVRGSDFSHLNFTVEGFATPFLMHMVRAVEERANTGSVAMINSDALEDVALANGSYPQRSGNRTGAELAFTLREGSRDRNVFRASVSGTSASGTAEGPLGRAKRGSWLISARQSYLDLLIDRLTDEGLSFGFHDVQAKLRYDLTSAQSLSATVLAGRSRLREVPDQTDDPDLFTGDNASAILIAAWRMTLDRGSLRVGAIGATNAFDNHTTAGLTLEEGTNDQVQVKADIDVRLHPRVRLESGVLTEYVEEFQRRQRRVTSTTGAVINDYHANAARSGGHARVELAIGPSWLVSPGARVDHSTLTDQTTASPWLQTELGIGRGLIIRAGTGLYQQFPDFEEVVGAFGGSAMRPERAFHADISVERRLSPSARVQVTIYNRQDKDVIRRPGADTRLVDGEVFRGSTAARFENRARGYARGAEILLQRSAPTALSGWLSYAYGRNHYEDQTTGETFWGDLDQRHTFNAYAFYRFSHRFSASAKLRMGSNFPIPGYYVREADRYVLSARRNLERLPAYARLDLRANRTFDWSRRRLTLFVEVINVLNRENVRFNPPRINSATREVTRLFDSLVPVVPSAGLLFEF
jgi:hypothetical protein